MFILETTDSRRFRNWLAKHGCTFEPGKGGRLLVRRGRKTAVLPMHGARQELGPGLIHRIKKQLGLK